MRACPLGHVDDLDWVGFVHQDGKRCHRQLRLTEQGTSGDLANLVVRCECKQSRRLYEATDIAQRPLGTCRGKRPWLGLDTDEECNRPSRLLIRTASNAYFAQVISALSLPDRSATAERVVRKLWDDLQIVESRAELDFIKKKPHIAEELSGIPDDEALTTIRRIRQGSSLNQSVKEAEIEALLKAPEGYGDESVDSEPGGDESVDGEPGGDESVDGEPGGDESVDSEPGNESVDSEPVDGDFHARRLPNTAWRASNSRMSREIESVVQLHRLREVQALIGFTRLEAEVRDIHGQYSTDVERADLALEPHWFPAVENRGEGIFAHISRTAVNTWLTRTQVMERLDTLKQQHTTWQQGRRKPRPFPGGPYIMLHTLAHLLIGSLAMRCGYPATSIRERIYVENNDYGLLLYTGTPDAEGTLGGLVQQARRFEDHLTHALQSGLLCSNDPICAQHAASEDIEQRGLHGAACHGCALIAETSCEMHNDYLDRALVVPVLGLPDAAFFPEP